MSLWWIDEPVFAGSSNPTTDELKDLFQVGFRTIVSLLDENEQPPNYDIDEAESMGFDRVSIPIRDFTSPSPKQLNQFLNAVNKAFDKGKIIMHCEGGTGRTGTMGAAYWIKKGLSAKEAIERVREVRPNAVESPEQEKSLEEFEKSLREWG